MRNYKRRSPGKGVMSAKTSFGVTSLNPPLWKPHPLGQDLLTQPVKILRAEPNCSVSLIGDVGRNRNKVLFCFGRNENGTTKGLTIRKNIPLTGKTSPFIPIDIARHPHTKITMPFLPDRRAVRALNAYRRGVSIFFLILKLFLQ